MSSSRNLREQVKHLALFASNSKNLDKVIEEVLNFVRNQKRNAIKEFLSKDIRTQNESFFSQGQRKTSTKLSKR